MPNIFQEIKDWVNGWFITIEKKYNELEPEIKTAIEDGSQVINVINTNLEATSQFTLDLIHDAIPNADIEKVKAGLQTVSADIAGLAAVPSDDIYTTLTKFQTYLKGLSPAKWAQESSTAAQKLSAFFASDTTPFDVIVSFLPYVYKKLIKKQ